MIVFVSAFFLAFAYRSDSSIYLRAVNKSSLGHFPAASERTEREREALSPVGDFSKTIFCSLAAAPVSRRRSVPPTPLHPAISANPDGAFPKRGLFRSAQSRHGRASSNPRDWPPRAARAPFPLPAVVSPAGPARAIHHPPPTRRCNNSAQIS